MTTKQLAILNSLVTFAAENVPGGLSPEETDVARLVGEWIRGFTPQELDQVFEYKLVQAAHGKAVEDVANQWSKHGWRVVGVVSPYKPGDGNQLIVERPRGDIRTETIRMEVDLEKIFTEASGALACDAGELINLIRDIEKEHDPK